MFLSFRRRSAAGCGLFLAEALVPQTRDWRCAGGEASVPPVGKQQDVMAESRKRGSNTKGGEAMKRSMILVLVALLVSGCATISTSGDYTLESGKTVRGDLVITSGNAWLEEDSRVTGNVFMTSGRLYVDGEVEGDIFLTSGNVDLGSNAVVHGDVKGTSGSVRRAPGARVDGEVSTGISGFSIGFSFFARFIFLLCVLPVLVMVAIILLIISLVRRRPAAPARPPTAPDEPAQKLKQLKQMLEDGLITEDEYEAKKAEILAGM